jgi:chloramphenicol 3-O-phosphotransferase
MIIGIAGPSCSGKTTIARVLAKRMRARLLHLDAFWIRGSAKPLVDGHPSFERPEQYDGAALLRSALDASIDGDVVIEGFLLFAYPGILEACASAFLIDVPHEELVRRRLRRGPESSDDVAGAGRVAQADRGWIAHGRKEWERYGAPQAGLPGVVVLHHRTTTDPVDVWVNGVVDDLMIAMEGTRR